MASTGATADQFSQLVREQGQQLQHALVAALGPEVGWEATSEALTSGNANRGSCSMPLTRPMAPVSVCWQRFRRQCAASPVQLSGKGRKAIAPARHLSE